MQFLIARLFEITQVSFIGAIFVAFLAAMIFSDGKANMNAYNEGWIETALAGILFIAGLKKIN